ncbi:hypothetical protein [Bradyrhizobium sp. S69]|uniref:hypothetical protein n=1 Tax=Bradyrhizobium sp. S69 TaxID=1641856 RepID=UPI00131BEE39|nr:hypothetical protein [Bradyrhizobium sp. S69]
MAETTGGTPVPTRKWLLAVIVALVVAQPIAARADDGLVDVRTLPRLEGAVEDTSRTSSNKLMYIVPTGLAETTPAIKRLLGADGWAQYTQPLEDAGTSLLFKKGRQGLYVSFTQRPKTPDQSSVYYDAGRINANLPFPDGAADIVFDENRPYLNCVSTATVDATLDFFRQALPAAGWSPLSAADAAARWPNVSLDDKIENGARAYYRRDGDSGQAPIMLSLQRRTDGKTNVDIRIVPFALVHDLGNGSEMAGLPTPDHIKTFGGEGRADSNIRKLRGTVIAEIPAVLGFFRRELAARNWREETSGATVTTDDVTLNFSSAEETAVLKLGSKYDLTTVSLVTQVKPTALAARAKAKKEADDKFFSDAQATAKSLMATDEARRMAQAANLSDAPLQARADNIAPVPVPEGAGTVQFSAAEGRLEFDSSSSVQALATFYRGALKSMGWKEEPSVINKSNMVVMEFAKGGKRLSFTALQIGPKVNVSASGSGLVMAAAEPDPAGQRKPSAAAAQTAAKDLEADPDSALPVPKEHSMSSLGTGKMPGNETPFRRELDASVPADIHSVLAFYRGQLGKLGWKEIADRATVKPDQAQLAFSSPEGPAILKLGRLDGETTINLAQKIPAAAAKADVAPRPGQAKLLLGNLGDSDASLTINKQTIKVAAGAGGPGVKGPTLELPPGKYQYSVKVAGGPAQNNEIEVAADDAWGLMLAPDATVLALHVY